MGSIRCVEERGAAPVTVIDSKSPAKMRVGVAAYPELRQSHPGPDGAPLGLSPADVEESVAETFAGARTATVLGLFFAAAVTALVYFSFISLARREVVNGSINPEAGALGVVSPREGLVTQALVAEGRQVKASDPLFMISLDTDLPTGPALAGRLDEAQAMRRSALGVQAQSDVLQEQATQADREARLQALREGRATLDAQLLLTRQRLTLAQQRVDKLEPLAAQGYFSVAQLQQLKDGLLQLRASDLGLQREIADNARSLAQLNAEAQGAAAKVKAAEAARASASAEVLQSSAQVDQQRLIVVRASRAGRVSSIGVKPGMTVKSGQNLATLLPAGSRLEAELLLPSRAAPFVARGDRIQLRYEGFPYQQFGVGYGTIKEVAIYPIEATGADPSASETLYRARATLDSQVVQTDDRAWPLYPGMRLSATVMLERDTVLGRWLKHLTPRR
jgi:membrane fusion protein